MIYDNCKIYGPYKYTKDKRRSFVIIYFPDGTRKATAYARFLIEKSLNRFLNNFEVVDHIDGNPSNDDLFNLQILNYKK